MKNFKRFLCCVFAMLMIATVTVSAEEIYVEDIDASEASIDSTVVDEEASVWATYPTLTPYSETCVDSALVGEDYANLFIAYTKKGLFGSSNSVATRMVLPWSVATSEMSAYTYARAYNENSGNFDEADSSTIISGAERYCSAIAGTSDTYVTKLVHTASLDYDNEEVIYYNDYVGW